MLINIFNTILFLLILLSVITGMKLEEKNQLRLQVIDMFKHAFGSYMVENNLLLKFHLIKLYF
jgi:hypothetical protein